MTYVLLTCDDDEKTIAFPTPENFQGYLLQVRRLVPDRRWDIAESWIR